VSHRDTGSGPPNYTPPRVLRNGQLQTLIGNLPPMRWFANRRGAALISSAQELLVDCGDGVRLQGFLSTARGNGNSGRAVEGSAESIGRRIAIVLHGWEGSAQSCYVISLGAELLARGYDVLRLNLRDHGTSHALNRGIFHSCRLAEVVGAVRSVAERFGGARIFLAGFSLGGNFMLRVSADADAPSTIAGAVAVSPVLDPAATLVALERGWWIYRRYFVQRWLRSLRRKRSAWPDLPDIEPILRSQDLRAMTAGLVRQFTDFQSLETYLEGYAVTGPRLASLRFPATVLLAEDDPMIPPGDLARLAPSPFLTIVGTRHGGHCGFVDRLNGPSFADRLVLSQFDRFEREASGAPDFLRKRAGTASCGEVCHSENGHLLSNNGHFSNRV
jgi:predicted alpha/beta-fold hydrolase